MAVLRRGNRSSLTKCQNASIDRAFTSAHRIVFFAFTFRSYGSFESGFKYLFFASPCVTCGTQLVVESFLVIDTRRISFNSYVTIHSEVALFLMSECLILSIKVLLCLFDFLEGPLEKPKRPSKALTSGCALARAAQSLSLFFLQ